MKLKTLKDFEVETAGQINLKFQLKQEAIKWVKFWNNINPQFNLISLEDWKKFFNITEEDLK